MALFKTGSPRKSRDLAHLAGHDVVGLLEPGVEIEGKMAVHSGLIRLNCHFKGELRSDGVVVLADQGEIDGEVHSKIISVAGKMKGAVHASERVEIKPQGVVVGDIYTPSLVVEPGGYFDGQCHMPTPVSVPHETGVKTAH
jgi:cytoskeletal protein CcmA (bactofilin family)